MFVSARNPGTEVDFRAGRPEQVSPTLELVIESALDERLAWDLVAMAEVSDAVLARVWRQTRARRELLWLRAMEVGDRSVSDLIERADPSLRVRMCALMEGRGLPPPDDPLCDDGILACFWNEHFHALVQAAEAEETP